jgi:glycine cleavage system H protein
MIPEDLFYSREHEWVRVEGDTATIGITHHAQSELGDLVFVELPAPGGRIEAGKPFGTVESVKAVSEVFAPLTGAVTGVHAELAEHPEWINQDPYGKGWMVKVGLAGGRPPAGLMSAADYRAFLASGT